MRYKTRLLMAKILVSLAVLVYAQMPLCENGLNIQALNGAAYGHLLAVPVLLFAIWGRLHGTGRSVRLVGFLGIAYWLGDRMGSHSVSAATSVFMLIALSLGVALSVKTTPSV
ncbi:MAG TPA: hypothetical protein ENJ42_08895 [Hellea balneolensis]|uniref:Uncharacterized protein n=1 Tax=Hellea balneolensis TaxID=287478 RepID=A0A7C5QX66_9PROT|nr:hypothetical protein [Hellea balneolensis]